MKRIVLGLLTIASLCFADDTNGKFYVGITEDGNTLEVGNQFQEDLRGYGALNYYKESAGDKNKWTIIGAGIDKIKSTGDKTILYYGVFAAKVTDEDDSGSIFVIRSGFEYFLNNNVTLGAEIDLYKRNIGDKRQGLDTSIGLKYYF